MRHEGGCLGDGTLQEILGRWRSGVRRVIFMPKSIDCLRAYSRSDLFHDTVAGLTVGVVALPLAMAFAIASGLPPQHGIHTAIIAGFLISLLGGSRVQIGGPTGAFVVLVSSIVQHHGHQGLLVCTLIAGVLLMLMGLGRLGGMIKFIPFPVVTGFTAGIAVVIFSTQIKDLLGLKMAAVPSEFFEKWAAYIHALPTANGTAAALGLSTVVFVFVLRHFYPRVPAMLVAMLLATVATAVLKLPVETIGSRFGDLPSGLPAPKIPTVTLESIRTLASPALTVALLAAIESLLSATVADGMIGSRHKSNVELVAQGVANVASAVFGGLPATGAIARTVTNIKSGAHTPVAGMLHALTLLLLLLVAAPLAKNIPLACLAGILVVVSYQMSEIERVRQLMRAPRSDIAVLATTFLLTVIIDLTVAVQVGVVLSSLLFIKRMSEVTNIGVVTRELKDQDEKSDLHGIARRNIPEGVEIFEISGPFFFGAAEKFKDTFHHRRGKPGVMILRLRDVPAVDATGLHAIDELHDRCGREGTTLILADVHTQPVMALHRSHLWDKIGEPNIFGTLDDAIARAREVLGIAPPPPDEDEVPTLA